MKKITTSLACLSLIGAMQAQITGPNSSAAPYLIKHPSVPNASVTSILTAGNSVSGYSMAGIPDGLGAFDNGDGSTFTLLLNHELGNGAGAVHAYGQPGTFVSKWVINKTTLAVTSGTDLTQNVRLWNGSSYTTYNAGNTSTLTNMGRYCSGDLAAVEAYYNKFTNTGTKDRIYLNGEETGNEGRMFAHIATGINAGYSYELPYLGRHSCENQVASAHSGSKTVVIGMDDTTPGQVYVYVGNKSNTGSVIERAGLVGGKLYGVQAIVGGAPIANENNVLNIPANSTFSLVALGNNGDVSAISGTSLNTQSNNLGVTNFLRPEDGSFDPSHPNDFYFVTTNGTTAPSRLWRLRFINIEQPELGGTITAVLDGTANNGVTPKMMDNITIDHSGHVLIVEDMGNNVHIGRVLQYDINSSVLSQVAYCDSTRFLNGGANFITQDEEASGITDAQEILGAGWFLSSIQVHAVPVPANPAIVEQGQLVALYNPASAANPEIGVAGNAVSIATGATLVSTGNNTDFGTLQLGAASVQKQFIISNTGNSVLHVSKIVLSGASASFFSLGSVPMPLAIPAGGSYTISVSFNPSQIGTKKAIVNIISNDYNEAFYDFTIQGKVAADGGVATGVSSSQSPYALPSISTVSLTSLLTVGDAIGGYTMVGIPDGLGAFDNGDGSFTLLMNHEFGNGLGAVHAHGQPGTFVSKWVINKSTLAVTSGADLIQNVKLWNGSSYTTYNSANTSTLVNMGRYCSGDLADVEAYYDKAAGLGTTDRIYLNGEETGNEGRMFAHIATGTEAGTSYELPYLGKHSCENQVATAHSGTKTVVIGMDDSTPGQVYVYVGNKSNTGSVIEKAGLVGGKLYGVQVIVGGSPIAAESNTLNIPANSTFSLVAAGNNGDVSAITGASLNTQSNNLGVTNFLRPEDGAWDSSSPNDFYFVTTNALNSPSRLWKLSFTNIEQPEMGGKITAVLDGTEGHKMLDNMTIDNTGHILLNEDVGNDVRLGKVWQYDIEADAMLEIAACDPDRFLTGAINYKTQDEETTGIIDVQHILGAGKFLTSVQSHIGLLSPMVEDGQLILVHNPASVANPEIDIVGSSAAINAGATSVSTSNNTDFGTVQVNSTIQKEFVIKNTGTATLKISKIFLSGADAVNFAIITPVSLPNSIAAGGSLTITVSFNSNAQGTKNAAITVVSNDYNETFYDFAIQAKADIDTGIENLTTENSSVILFPNPNAGEATVRLNLDNVAIVSVKVFDVQGKLVSSIADKNLNSGVQEISISTKELANGNYFVRVSNNGKITTLKMTVAH